MLPLKWGPHKTRKRVLVSPPLRSVDRYELEAVIHDRQNPSCETVTAPSQITGADVVMVAQPGFPP